MITRHDLYRVFRLYRRRQMAARDSMTAEQKLAPQCSAATDAKAQVETDKVELENKGLNLFIH